MTRDGVRCARGWGGNGNERRDWPGRADDRGHQPLAGDLVTEQQVISGRAAAELARIARGDDVIVLGARHRGPLGRLATGSVARACARRADCPVVAVPEPSATALASAAAAGVTRGCGYR